MTTESATHSTWRGMRERCNNPNHKQFRHYGGRGVSVCSRWDSFENFLEDMGERPHGMSIDRIDNDGNYEPSNCRWATVLEQRRNRRPRSPRTHCSVGHELTPENTIIKKRNSRVCRECAVAYQKQYDARRRDAAIGWADD